MPREKRKAALKATKYTDEAPTDSEDEDVEAGETSRSAKSKGKGKARASVDEEDWSAADEDDEPAKKKRKTATAKGKGKGTGRGRKGKLAAFNEMPLDVLYCIAQYLDPLTLLHMSRANKAMHSLLASRSSSSIWQVARNPVFLPDLTANDLTEMQYASLVFERSCHLCGRGRASIVDYALRIRWCKSCQRANLLPANKIQIQLDFLDESALKCSLTTEHSLSGRNWGKKAYYCKHDVAQISDELAALKDEIAAAKGKVKRAEATAALDDYIKEREAVVKAAKKDGETLHKWEMSDFLSRKKAGNDARIARRKAIEDRLTGLGYHQDDAKNLYGVWQLVDQPTVLTDTIWSRISTAVINAAESNKRNRLSREASRRQSVRRLAVREYYDRLVAQEDAEIARRYPSFSSFVQFPHVEPFWREEDSDISQTKWNEALDEIKEDVKKALRVIKVNYARSALTAIKSAGAPYDDNLYARLTAPPPPSTADEPAEPAMPGAYVDDYELRNGKLDLNDSAPTVTDDELDSVLSRFLSQFYCSAYSCYSVLPFPANHEHTTNGQHGNLPATGKTSQLPNYLVKQLLAVLDETGFEDKVETAQELDKLGPVFDCRGCEASRRGAGRGWMFGGMQQTVQSEGLTWSEMIKHYPKHHSSAQYYNDPPPPKIVLSAAGQALLPPGQLEQAKQPKAARELDERKKAAEKHAAAAAKRVEENEAEEKAKDEERLIAEVEAQQGRDLTLSETDEEDLEALAQMAAVYAEGGDMDL